MSDYTFEDHLSDEIGQIFDSIHFQTNCAGTRLTVVESVTCTLNAALNDGHIVDFKVTCDDSNNPQSVLDQRDLVLDIAYRLKSRAISGGTYKTKLSAWNDPVTTSDMTWAQLAVPMRSRSSVLPAIRFNDEDRIGKQVSMRLKPESTITTHELSLIVQLFIAASGSPTIFSSYEFIKANDLERHFVFE